MNTPSVTGSTRVRHYSVVGQGVSLTLHPPQPCEGGGHDVLGVRVGKSGRENVFDSTLTTEKQGLYGNFSQKQYQLMFTLTSFGAVQPSSLLRPGVGLTRGRGTEVPRIDLLPTKRVKE